MVDQVLVHISTPATIQNDDLFRSLADAYLDFKPHSCLKDEIHREIDEQNMTSPAQVENNAAPSNVPQDWPAVETSILSTSKESYGSFPSHLSSGYQADVCAGFINNDSISTSSRLARLDRIHMHWKEQTTPRSSFAKKRRRSRPTSPTSDEVGTAFIEDTQLGAQALQSQLQDNYSSTNEDTSEGESEQDFLSSEMPSIPSSQRSTRIIRSTQLGVVGSTEPTPILPRRVTGLDAIQESGSRVVNVHKLVLTTQDTPTAKVSADQQDVPRLEGILGSSGSATQASSKKQKTTYKIGNSADAPDFSRLSRDAYPPAPKVSIERPSRLPSQVTKHLAAIKVQNPKRFRCSKMHRTPKADERGYWSAPCSNWPIKLQYEFWVSLCEQVSSGRLGWGTTLHREALSAHALGKVRLYCWAEAAEHTWLILWLCSKGQIAGSGSKWCDADGAVVYEVL